ncbi:MAG: DUF2247 family protein [Allomuricauda sp.]
MVNKLKMSLDWNLIYVGLNRDWLSTKEALERVNPKCLTNLGAEKLGELYSKEDDKQGFLETLASYINWSDNELENALKYWMKHFLIKIHNSDLTVGEKLNKIASLWPSFEYPQEWKKFINYMPAEDGDEIGEGALYNNFITYLESM